MGILLCLVGKTRSRQEMVVCDMGIWRGATGASGSLKTNGCGLGPLVTGKQMCARGPKEPKSQGSWRVGFGEAFSLSCSVGDYPAFSW